MSIEIATKPERKKRKAKRLTGVVVELGNSRIVAEMTGVAPRKPKPTMRLVMTLGHC